MDKFFQMNATTFFSERHGHISTKFRKENSRNVAFLESIAIEQEEIRKLVSADVWQRLNRFIELLGIHSDVKSKYLYAQGIKDCISISNYLESEFINMDLDEIWKNTSDL